MMKKFDVKKQMNMMLNLHYNGDIWGQLVHFSIQQYLNNHRPYNCKCLNVKSLQV
jgi:hypothetical protein